MTDPLKVTHAHEPVYRVVRRGWSDPIDASFSRRGPDNRWNTADFPALYCCCCERVARAVTLDTFRFAGIEIEDVQPGYRPQLAEVSWSGTVVDVSSARGVARAGLDRDYPNGVDKERTRSLAEEWHRGGAEGVVCRSASLARLGFSGWRGAHEGWSEVSIFVVNCSRAPALRRRRQDLDWLLKPPHRS